MAEALAINSAGTLVGAILESAGYIYQAHILKELADPLKSEIGALVYLIGIIISISQIVVFKSSKMAPWLLIGPAIFLFVINELETMPLARWSFGTHERSQADVDNGVQEITEGKVGDVKVSKVFKKYVEVVSAVNRSLVDKISGIQVENDLWMLAKGDLYGRMTTIQEGDPGLRQLVHFGLLEQCGKAIQAAKAIDDPTKRNVSPDVVQGMVDQAKRFFSPTAFLAKQQYNRLVKERSINFKEADAARNFIAEQEGLSGDALENRKKELADLNFSCEEVWTFALRGILNKSEEFKENLKAQASRLKMNPDALTNLLSQASGLGSKDAKLTSTLGFDGDQGKELALVIAKFYLRNETRNNDISSRITALVGRNNIRKIGISRKGENTITEETRVAAGEWAEKERLETAAHSLPTYQGLALYFLGVAFPFFALLLLIPGKSTGFLLWFMLWLWIKSWDVALALVAQLDTIFWSIYVVQKNNLNLKDDLSTDFAAAFASLELMDPTFQMTGYYALLSVSVLAIPAIMAQLIMGSMKGGASLISGGMSKFADFYSDATLIRTEQSAINELKSEQIGLKELRGLGYAFNGPVRDQALEGSSSGNMINPDNLTRPTGGRSSGGRDGAPARIPYDGNSGGGGSNDSRGLNLSERRSGAGEGSGGIGARTNSSNFQARNYSRAGVEYPYKGAMTQNIKSFYDTMNSMTGDVSYQEKFAKPNRPIHDNMSGAVDAGIKTGTAIDRKYNSAIADKGLASQLAELQAGMAHAAFETDIDPKSYELHKRIATLRGIPVPWLEFGMEGSGVELVRHEKKFEEEVAILKGLVGGYLEIVDSTNAGASVVSFGKNLDTIYNVGAGAGGIYAINYLMNQIPDELKNSLLAAHNLASEEDSKEEKELKLKKYFSDNYTDEDIFNLSNNISTLVSSPDRTEEELSFYNTEYDILNPDSQKDPYFRSRAIRDSMNRKTPGYERKSSLIEYD